MKHPQVGLPHTAGSLRASVQTGLEGLLGDCSAWPGGWGGFCRMAAVPPGKRTWKGRWGRDHRGSWQLWMGVRWRARAGTSWSTPSREGSQLLGLSGRPSPGGRLAWLPGNWLEPKEWVLQACLVSAVLPLARTPTFLAALPRGAELKAGRARAKPSCVPEDGGETRESQAAYRSVSQMRSVRSEAWSLCRPASCTRGGGGKASRTVTGRHVLEKPSGSPRPAMTAPPRVTVMTA